MFFATILRNVELPIELRLAAAKKLVSLVHARLAVIGRITWVQTPEDRLRELRQLLEAIPAVDGG